MACRKASALGYTAAGSMTTGAMTISVANSKGVFVEFESTIADASTVIMNGTASGWSHASGWKLDAVDWEQLSNEALEKVRIGQKTVDVEPAEMTVILDPFATSDLLGMLAYDGMSGLAYQEERSWMNGRSGQKLMSPEVTIFDDGNDLRGIPLPFDFEGQPKRRVAMVESGSLRQSGVRHAYGEPKARPEIDRSRHATIGGWSNRPLALESVSEPRHV